MLKKHLFALTIVLCIVFAFTSAGHAVVLLKPGKALKKILGKTVEIEKETHRLKGDVLAKVKERLGGSLVDSQKGSESAKVKEQTKYDFHCAVKDGKRSGVAIIDSQPGKWGPVEFIIGLTMKGAVKKVMVMSYSEKRGRPIARKSFLSQYKGKSGKSLLIVGKDITGISGATISSKAATFSVKKAIVLYGELYLNK